MAATEAPRRNRTAARTATRNRLPLTPKVTTSRRGGHEVARRTQPVEAPVAAATVATPAMHVTPNVVIAARGDVSARRSGGLRALTRVDASDLRRFRA